MDATNIGEFYIANLPPQMEALALAISDTEAGDESAAESVLRVSHQLKGSGRTYGFPEVTEAAAAVLNVEGDDMVAAAKSLLGIVEGLIATSSAPHARLVVVEDDPLMQAIIDRVIGTAQRDIRFADTGEDGLRLLEDGADLVLLDLFLPDMDGRDVLRRIRRSPNLDKVHVIVLSGADSDLARAESVALGADAFLGKPFEATQLSTLVSSMLTTAKPETEGGSDRRSASRDGHASIVVAEDDSLVASLVVDRLTREGYVVDHEADGAAALKRVLEAAPDLVVLDVKLPRLNGFEVLKTIRTAPELTGTSVIVLTAMGGEHDVVRGFDLGADDYLLKPFSPTELVARVKHLLEHA